MGLVYLSDGSSVWGKLDTLEGDMLTLELHDHSTLVLPWEQVAQINMRSDRMAWLSDLKPIEVDDKPLFSLGGWGRDKSWLGKPITLGRKVYEKGLGVHAPCRLVYEANGRYDTFAAVIGIDDETHRQHGDCVYKVIGDGRVFYTQRVTSKDKPRLIRVDISGIKRLTLQVEVGEDLDTGDHADWADARLIRQTDREGGS